MRIDQKLNIVFPVDTDRGTVYVHSTPIGRDLFERHYLVIGKTFSRIMTEGLTLVQGPNMAALLLRDVAKETSVPGRPGSAWEGPDGVERSLIPEIRRLTNVAVPSDDGYRTMPYEMARREGAIDDDDGAAVENAITFFTVASWGSRSQPARTIQALHDGMRLLWAAQITSSSITEFCASLTTSTPPEAMTPETPSAPSLTTLPSPPRGNSSAVIPT